MTKTKDNTRFAFWRALANKAFKDRGLPEPSFDEAAGAYEIGHSPETWADYVLNS